MNCGSQILSGISVGILLAFAWQYLWGPPWVAATLWQIITPGQPSNYF